MLNGKWPESQPRQNALVHQAVLFLEYPDDFRLGIIRESNLGSGDFLGNTCVGTRDIHHGLQWQVVVAGQGFTFRHSILVQQDIRIREVVEQELTEAFFGVLEDLTVTVALPSQIREESGVPTSSI